MPWGRTISWRIVVLILMVVEMSNLSTADLVFSCPDYKSDFAEIVTALAALPSSLQVRRSNETIVLSSGPTSSEVQPSERGGGGGCEVDGFPHLHQVPDFGVRIVVLVAAWHRLTLHIEFLNCRQ